VANTIVSKRTLKNKIAVRYTMSINTKNSCASWGPLALRIVTGLIFVIAGFSKLQGIDGFAGALASSGYPATMFLAYLVAIVELVAGAMLVLGIQTQKAAIPLKVIIIFAVITKLLGGFGGPGWNAVRYDLLLIAALTVLVGYGSGKWSAMACCSNSEDKKEAESKKKPAKKSSSKKSSKKSSDKKSSSKKSSSKKKKSSSKKSKE
jgi:putative oxidoreductase